MSPSDEKAFYPRHTLIEGERNVKQKGCLWTMMFEVVQPIGTQEYLVEEGPRTTP